MSATIQCDLAIVGGGLAGGLIALALKHKRPDCDVRLIERGDSLGGNHLWSFFGSDVAPADRWLVAPLIGHSWTRYDVAFPGHARTLDEYYHSIESRDFDRILRDQLGLGALMLGRDVAEVTPKEVAMADGSWIEARGVIDCRGAGDLSALDLGWQKFLGRELALTQAHGVDRPVVMDATVEQSDGYRFVYALPLAAEHIFLEDTYYSDTPEIDAAALGARIDAYAQQKGWRVTETVREEAGALPVAMGGDFEAHWRAGGEGVAKAGMRAALFHPLTGYSLPDAVRTAMLVTKAPSFDGTALHDLLHGHAHALWRKRRFYRMLAAMLFKAAEPEQRYRVLERFYTLDPRLVGRFYAAQSTLPDKLRILSGRPPIPIGRALKAMGAST
ncbi:lycopene beta-cyclase CrtY [Sphingomonas sp. MMS12-HWE2-04]|uniref:lycopene beta-cyclase CrtY n=1 Tax=Sphingomonas sp. MMS12-HWE2-04 TaxID=3234199 RepID=UPI00384F2D27